MFCDRCGRRIEEDGDIARDSDLLDEAGGGVVREGGNPLGLIPK
jgi:hypothetical protein